MAKPIEATPPLSAEETVFFLDRLQKSPIPAQPVKVVNFKAVHEKIMKKATQGGKKHI